jgi:hypothetical protein
MEKLDTIHVTRPSFVVNLIHLSTAQIQIHINNVVDLF